MKKDIHELKKLIFDIIDNNDINDASLKNNNQMLKKLYNDIAENENVSVQPEISISKINNDIDKFDDTEEILEETFSLQQKEIDFIKKALEKYNGKRKKAAQELGISERTLYRKIKEYEIE